MSEAPQPTFLVSAYSEPVVVRVNGKANYLNCNTFREFIEKMVEDGKGQFIIDFKNCKGMDSTFLGILAGTALDLRQQTPPGVLILSQLSPRNYELICNLGLQNILSIAEDIPEAEQESSGEQFASLKNVEVSDARTILKAHESLLEADTGNAAKFQDVIAFLRNQVENE